jgi:CIC family chloride channel protein
MISNTIAYLLSRQYQQKALFDLLSRQDGMDLPSMEERREEVSIHVEDAMRPYQYAVLNIDDSLSLALLRSAASSEDFVFVEDGTGNWYGITKEELQHLATPARGAQPCAACCRAKPCRICIRTIS